MKWFNNIKIRNKLLFVFGLLAFIMIFFAVFVIGRLYGISREVNELVFSYQARQVQIADAMVDAFNIRIANLVRGYARDDSDFENKISFLLEQYENNADSFLDNMNNYTRIMMADPRLGEDELQQRIEILRSIEDAYEDYGKYAEDLKIVLDGGDEYQLLRVMETGIPIGNVITSRLMTLRDITFRTTMEKTAEVIDHSDRIVATVAFITLWFILLVILFLAFTIRSINRPIAHLEKSVVEIANGNLTCKIRSSRKDELGALSNCVADMVDKISEHGKMEAIMDNLDSMICVLDSKLNVLFINKALVNRYKVNRQDCIGHKCYKAIRNKDAPCSFCKLPELIANVDICQSISYEYVWDDTLNAWVGGTDAVINWVDGSLAFFQSRRDVTQNKLHEEQLSEALNAAKSASIAKSSFLANMSHEIRTPMNAILGITEIQLRNENLAPDMEEALHKIYNSGDLLLNIINDILDLSKIESGKLELNPSKYETASMINDTVTLNVMRIGSKPIEFHLSVDENMPVTMMGDELRIKQILNNLLSNAFKYTAKGEVELSVSAERGEGKDQPGVILVCRVSDTGQGLTEEQVTKLRQFDEYIRFNAEANRTTEGTGLGMSITNNLIKLMDGEISVESEPGKGSVFTVRLPQGVIGSDVIGKEMAKSLANFEQSGNKQLKKSQIVFEPMPYGSVLVVDDVESNLYVAKGLMAPYELSIETAMSGQEALDKLSGGKVYDIVFMDHMMPGMDGIQTTEKIRDLGYTRPIVALTANAVVGQADIFMGNGFDGFISKPIDMRQLNLTLKKFVRDKQPPEVIAAANRKKDERKGSVSEDVAQRIGLFPRLIEFFLRDASKSVAILEAIQEKGRDGVYEEDDVRMYTINVHAMKSALANIGEKELSAAALKLEQAGRAKDTAAMSAGTPLFLNNLKAVIEKLTPQEEAGGETADSGYLHEKLLAIKEACATYDKKTAKNAISELRRKKWADPVKETLSAMFEHLLNGDFEEVSVLAEKIIGTT